MCGERVWDVGCRVRAHLVPHVDVRDVPRGMFRPRVVEERDVVLRRTRGKNNHFAETSLHCILYDECITLNAPRPTAQSELRPRVVEEGDVVLRRASVFTGVPRS